MTEKYGLDLERILKDLSRRLARVEAALKVKPGLNIVRASGAFNLPTTFGATRPDTGASLYHDGSTLRMIDASGNDTPVGGVNMTTRPQYPSSFSSPATISGTPTAANYNALRADAAMLQVCLRDVINRGAEIPLWPSG